LDLNNKLYGLVGMFISSASPHLCLQILANAHKALGERTLVIVSLLEDTLHSYFTQTQDHQIALIKATNSLDLTKISWGDRVFACTETNAALTLRVLLEQQKGSISNLGEENFAKSADILFDSVIGFVPNKHREFDLFVLWFFALELISDQRWTHDPSNKKVQLFQTQLRLFHENAGVFEKSTLQKVNVFVPKDPSIIMKLGSQACLLYLEKIFARKSEVGKSTAEHLQKLLEALMSLRQQDAYQRYDPFFVEMESILSPLWDLPQFEAALIKTLAPIAPYLLNVIPSYLPLPDEE